MTIIYEDEQFSIVKTEEEEFQVFNKDNTLICTTFSSTGAIQFVFSHYTLKNFDVDNLPNGADYNPPERIVCAANKYGDQVIAGVRHGCDAMSDSLDTAITYHAIKNQINRWFLDSHLPEYSEGHASTYCVYRLRPIIAKHGQHIPDFKRNQEIQGFLTSKYRFVDRIEAWKIAVEQNQIVRRVGNDTEDGGTLYTENLY